MVITIIPSRAYNAIRDVADRVYVAGAGAIAAAAGRRARPRAQPVPRPPRSFEPVTTSFCHDHPKTESDVRLFIYFLFFSSRRAPTSRERMGTRGHNGFAHDTNR